MNTAEQIMVGKVELPEQILELVGKEQELAKQMFQSIWYNFLKNKGSTSTTYWYDQFKSRNTMNKYLYHLTKSGWVISTVVANRNWAELSFNESKLLNYITQEEIEQVRVDTKFNKYVMTNVMDNDTSHLTKTNNKLQDVGLVRKGFTKSASSLFKLDTEYLDKYFDEILANTVKGLSSMSIDIDDADYMNVCKHVLNTYRYSTSSTYCMNGAVSDSRGRNIYKGLSKIFNPIGFKDARALIVLEPRSLGITGRTSVFKALAELLGIKADTHTERAELAEETYKNRVLPEAVSGKELHERIWVERIYDNLDNYNGKNWTVPIELD